MEDKAKPLADPLEPTHRFHFKAYGVWGTDSSNVSQANLRNLCMTSEASELQLPSLFTLMLTKRWALYLPKAQLPTLLISVVSI